MTGFTAARRWALALGGLALVAVALARWIVDGLGYSTPCPFRDSFGLPCPTCHGLRALAALGRGEILAAIGTHPLIALGALILLFLGAASLLLAFLRRPPLPHPFALPGPRRLLFLAAVALLANWALLLFRR